MIPVILRARGAVHLDDGAGLRLAAPQSLVDLVPEAVARDNQVFPLSTDGVTVVFAARNAGDILLADKLTFIINRRVRLVAHPVADILAAIDAHYSRRAAADDLDEDDTLTESVDSMLMEAPAPAAAPPATATGGGWAKARMAPARAAALRAIPEQQPADGGPREHHTAGRAGMFFYTVDEGRRVLMTRADGRVEVVIGPRQVWQSGRRFEPMRHHVAHPGEFLVVRFRDGRQEHLTGPTDLWFDPRVHEDVSRQDALQLANKEAVIVYSRPGGAEAVSRRLVYGPTLFVPVPGEWLHTFAWHGSDGGSRGQKKVAKGLVFQKLWLMPDQMYHDVPDVRTADDAVLTIKLMLFFELVDVERMLDATHDPIGDFINAATSDVVDFCGRRTFEAFKLETGLLNEIETYRQLTARAVQNGYRVNKVVYRGYGAPDRLQAMHDQAIEARTKLQLERATEEQAQGLEDFKLNAQMNRAARRRTEQAVEVETELELARKRQEAEARQVEAARTAARDQRRLDAEAAQAAGRQANDEQRRHLSALKELGVDLTALLTQGRADRVIELRGAGGRTPHVHLGAEGEGRARPN